ncbi:MAG: Trk system potassium transporter TrkA [Bacteroidales bacterium]|nr:Trk system potassium transporter TrkA [Bacteroidales bacterium]
MKIVIVGAGEVGAHLAKMLSGGAHDITVIDSDAVRLQALSAAADIIAVEGNPVSIEVLKQAEADKADLFIAVYPSSSQNVNVVSALLAKKMGSKKVTARINNEEYLSYDNRYLFTEMGIDLLFYPEKIAAGEILDLLTRTAATDSLDFGRGKLQMAVFKLVDESPIIDMTLQEFAKSAPAGNLQFRVVAISRNEETFIPKSDTRFKYNDLLFIIAKREGIEPLMQYIGKSNIAVRSVMIMGGSPIGEMVARSLAERGFVVKIIDNDKQRCAQLSESLPDSVMVINGDGRDSDLLVDENIRNFDAFVALTKSSEANILACVAAKKMGMGRTIAQVENLEYISLAEGMGVDAVINKKLITAGRIFKFTLSDKVRFVKYMSGTNAEIIEFIVSPESRITKAALKDLDFPENAIIGGVIRGGDSFIAVGDTKIQAYDRVAVFAMPDSVKEVDKWFK